MNVTFKDCFFDGNSVLNNGGVISMNNEHLSLYVSGSVFIYNIAITGNGGTFFILNAQNVNITNNTF